MEIRGSRLFLYWNGRKAEDTVEKRTDDEKNIGNFRFKIYLKSNLERIFCTRDGEIFWVDKNGKTVQIEEYQKNFQELVQKIYTKKADRQVLETVGRR